MPDRCNSLAPIDLSRFTTTIEQAKQQLKKKLGYSFFMERYSPHITYLYYNRLKHGKTELLQNCHTLINQLPDDSKTFTLGDIRTLEGQRDYNFIVIDVIIDPIIKQIRTELYQKYNVPDRMDYNPHVTLGKIKKTTTTPTLNFNYDKSKYKFTVT